MAQIHNTTLRVNSTVPDDTVDIWLEQGWVEGPHPDTDPDEVADNIAVPRVLPRGNTMTPDPEPTTPAKADKPTKD